MQRYYYIGSIILTLLIQGCFQKKENSIEISTEINNIQELLANSEYTFKQLDKCSCGLEGPSAFDFVGTTQWHFDLKNIIQISDTFLTHTVELRFKSHEDVSVNVLEWYVETSAEGKKERSTYEYVPIVTFDQAKAKKLIKQFKSAAKICGAQLE